MMGLAALPQQVTYLLRRTPHATSVPVDTP